MKTQFTSLRKFIRYVGVAAITMLFFGCGGGGGSSSSSNSTSYVTTLAGSGAIGATDATGTAASFNSPAGVAVDAAGNVYVADTFNNNIRKITSAGVVTTLAGSGTVGAVDATGTAASFFNPFGVAVDAAGNVYVGDYNNHKIRKITSAGVVTTLAGSGTVGAVDATGTAASFYQPAGVAVDAAGNVYVADGSNHKIRKITSAGVVTTLAGSGTIGAVDATGTAASFKYPYGIAVDAAGNVYVGDSNNHKIRKITSAGVVTTLAGSGAIGATDATGTAASFNFPYGVAVDAAGNAYVADYGNNKIRKIIP
jgi:serine/threonine-protein kinase